MTIMMTVTMCFGIFLFSLALIGLVGGWIFYCIAYFFMGFGLIITIPLSILVIFGYGIYRFCKGRFIKHYEFHSDWKQINEIFPDPNLRKKKYGLVGNFFRTPSEYNPTLVKLIENILKNKQMKYKIIEDIKTINIFGLSYFETFIINISEGEIILGVFRLNDNHKVGSKDLVIAIGNININRDVVIDLATAIDEAINAHPKEEPPE